MKNPAQEGMIAALTERLGDMGFAAEPVREGILVFEDARVPDTQKLIDAIPELKEYPMQVEEGLVFIKVES